MANEVQFRNRTGSVAYFVARNHTSGFVWNQSGSTSGAFEAFTSGNWASYGVSATEQGVNGHFAGAFPNVVAGGIYAITAHERIGATMVQTDPAVAEGDFHWNGSIVVPRSDLATSGQVGQFAPVRLARSWAISGFLFYLVSSADHVTPFTSGIISGQISRDGGSFGALQSGLLTTAYPEVGLGWFKVNLTSGDLNANMAAINFQAVGVSGGAADQRNIALILQRVSGQ